MKENCYFDYFKKKFISTTNDDLKNYKSSLENINETKYFYKNSTNLHLQANLLDCGKKVDIYNDDIMKYSYFPCEFYIMFDYFNQDLDYNIPGYVILFEKIDNYYKIYKEDVIPNSDNMVVKYGLLEKFGSHKLSIKDLKDGFITVEKYEKYLQFSFSKISNVYFDKFINYFHNIIKNDDSKNENLEFPGMLLYIKNIIYKFNIKGDYLNYFLDYFTSDKDYSKYFMVKTIIIQLTGIRNNEPNYNLIYIDTMYTFKIKIVSNNIEIQFESIEAISESTHLYFLQLYTMIEKDFNNKFEDIKDFYLSMKILPIIPLKITKLRLNQLIEKQPERYGELYSKLCQFNKQPYIIDNSKFDDYKKYVKDIYGEEKMSKYYLKSGGDYFSCMPSELAKIYLPKFDVFNFK